MADKPPSTSATPDPQSGMNKWEAVKQALAKLGNDARPLDIQRFVKTEFNIDMTTDLVSNYKGKILRQEPGGGKARTQGKPAAKPTAKPAAPKAATPPAGGISLKDIETIKGLVGRVGPEQLRSLVDLLAK